MKPLSIDHIPVKMAKHRYKELSSARSSLLRHTRLNCQQFYICPKRTSDDFALSPSCADFHSDYLNTCIAADLQVLMSHMKRNFPHITFEDKK